MEKMETIAKEIKNRMIMRAISLGNSFEDIYFILYGDYPDDLSHEVLMSDSTLEKLTIVAILKLKK